MVGQAEGAEMAGVEMVVGVEKAGVEMAGVQGAVRKAEGKVEGGVGVGRVGVGMGKAEGGEGVGKVAMVEREGVKVAKVAAHRKLAISISPESCSRSTHKHKVQQTPGSQ